MSENEELPESQSEKHPAKEGERKTIPLRGMYENWFLDYASYVILERVQ